MTREPCPARPRRGRSPSTKRHSQVVTIRGDSYRLREKRCAGLIKAAQFNQEQLA
ncbi:MAG TPA: hypothetical protein VFE63_16610 [Roseiarcus sp.]|nr:hypothetical protein [Roseiarcus sp.]